MRDVADGEIMWGMPAQPEKQTKRQILATRKLPELLKRVKQIERKLGIQPQRDAD
jgi:UDP-3-O-[3-hydroxymyristoyl] glucosamine N-acyltransferase